MVSMDEIIAELKKRGVKTRRHEKKADFINAYDSLVYRTETIFYLKKNRGDSFYLSTGHRGDIEFHTYAGNYFDKLIICFGASVQTLDEICKYIIDEIDEMEAHRQKWRKEREAEEKETEA